MGFSAETGGNKFDHMVSADQLKQRAHTQSKSSREKLSADISAEASEHSPRQRLQEKLDALAAQYGVHSIRLYADRDYDYAGLNEAFPNIQNAFALLPENASEPLRRIDVYLNNQSLRSNLFAKEGMSFYEEGVPCISLDYDESPTEIAADIQDGLREFQPFWDRMNAQFLDLGDRYDFYLQGFLPDQVYDYQNFEVYLDRAKRLLQSIPDTLYEKIREIPIYFGQSDAVEAREVWGEFSLVVPSNKTPEEVIRLLTDFADLESFFTGISSNRSQEERQERRSKQEFLLDPALRLVLDIDLYWLEPHPQSFKQAQEYRMLVARSLYFQDKVPNQANVQTEYERILSARERYEHIPLFQGRNVLMLAHSEELRDVVDENGNPYPDYQYERWESKSGDDKYRFGKTNLQNALRDQGANLSFLRPKKTPQSLVDNQKEALRLISETAPPFTFIFNGHGGKEALYLSDGNVVDGEVQDEGAVKITADQLAEAFRSRYEKYPELKTATPEQQDILIFSSCYNANYIRSFYQKIQGIGNFPVTFGSAEYGQYGYSNFTSRFGSRFFEDVMDFSDPDSVKTFGTLLENEKKYSMINPSLFIPVDNSTAKDFIQIAEGRRQGRSREEKLS